MSLISLDNKVQAILHQAIEAHIFPGAVAAISQGANILSRQALGTTAYTDAQSQPVTFDTIYDIASLTKMITATAALRLMEAGLLDLQMPVCYYLPNLAMQDVLIWHLLTHSSGLDLRLSSLAYEGASVLRLAIAQLQPSYKPGSVAAYTNINALLLGDVVAQVYGSGLDTALQELVLQPLAMKTTQFCPDKKLISQIAPTEIDETLRKGLVHGVVHDESAYVLSGIAGHAGLFSTWSDLLCFCWAWLGLPPYQDFLQCTTRELAFRNHSPQLNLSCGLGWMLERPAFMGRMTPYAVGHTGFTGPVIVIVPDTKLAIIMLSNRSYPKRNLPTHHTVTAALVEAASDLCTDSQNML